MNTGAVVIFLTFLLFASADECIQNDDTCSSSSHDPHPQLTKLKLGLEWFVNPDHLPLIVAKSHGIFHEFGLDIELVEPSDHWEAEEEIMMGNLDIAVTEPLHLAQDAAKNKPVLGFTRFLHTDGGVLYDASREDIKRPADMCGKVISYPGSPGPGGPAIIDTMVKADGKLDCDLDSYGKYNGGFFHTDALQSASADVATLIFWNFEIPEARAKGMVEPAFFSLKDWGVPDFCQLILMTTPTRYEELKPALRKLVLAMRRATGIIHQKPDLARKYYHDFVNYADAEQTQKSIIDATFTATLPAFPNDNNMSREYYDRLMNWLVETGQVEIQNDSNEENGVVSVPVDVYWTNEVSW